MFSPPPSNEHTCPNDSAKLLPLRSQPVGSRSLVVSATSILFFCMISQNISYGKRYFEKKRNRLDRDRRMIITGLMISRWRWVYDRRCPRRYLHQFPELIWNLMLTEVVRPNGMDSVEKLTETPEKERMVFNHPLLLLIDFFPAPTSAGYSETPPAKDSSIPQFPLSWGGGTAVPPRGDIGRSVH